MNHWTLKLAQRLLLLTALAIVGALLSATMVRFAPGYGVDERDLDFRLSQASKEAIRNEHQLSGGLIGYYGSYISGLLHGNLGTSGVPPAPGGWSFERTGLPDRTRRTAGFGNGVDRSVRFVSALHSLAILGARIFRDGFHRVADCFAHGRRRPTLFVSSRSCFYWDCRHHRCPNFFAISAIFLRKRMHSHSSWRRARAA